MKLLNVMAAAQLSMKVTLLYYNKDTM